MPTFHLLSLSPPLPPIASFLSHHTTLHSPKRVLANFMTSIGGRLAGGLSGGGGEVGMSELASEGQTFRSIDISDYYDKDA